MIDANKNLRNSHGNQQQHKMQQRKNSKQTVDIPFYMKALLDLSPAIKNFLNMTAESKVRVAATQEKNAQNLEKLIENLPEMIKQAPFRREPHKRKINARKQELLDLVKKLRDDEMTYEEIVTYLTENKIPTFSGRGRWHAQTIHRICTYYP